jgi:hypothetical protein
MCPCLLAPLELCASEVCCSSSVVTLRHMLPLNPTSPNRSNTPTAHFVTSTTPSLPFWNALRHIELTFSSTLNLAAVQSASCSVLTFFSSSAFHLSFAVSSRPMRTSRLMGSGVVGSGSTMPLSRTACWWSRALWCRRLRAWMLRDR